MSMDLIAFISHPVSIVFALSCAVQLFIHWYLYGQLVYFRRKDTKVETSPPISVIITAKNEAKNLKRFLPSILNQNYPDFEVIVVNDHSEDETEEVLHNFKTKYKNLEIVNLDKNIKDRPGKKLALSLAIRKARNEILLFTDADCEAASSEWILEMVKNYKAQTQIVLGFSAYRIGSSVWHLMVGYDTFFTGLHYLSLALAGKPYMGVGRNLSYRKSFFFEKKGFKHQLHVPFGDDDLFVNRNATRTNTTVSLAPKSFIYTLPPPSLKSWFRQKLRHNLAGNEYTSSSRYLLGSIYMSHYLFWLAGLLSILLNPEITPALLLFLIRYISAYTVSLLAHKKIPSMKAPALLIIYELIYFFIYLPLMAFEVKFLKSYRGW